MKRIGIVFAFLLMVMTVFAQNSKTEVDVESFEQDIKTQMESMRQQLNDAMGQLQGQMNTMQFKSDGNSNIIIMNGDTISVKDGEAFGIDMGEMFQHLPEGMEQLKGFFGQEDGGFQDMFKMFENFDFNSFGFEGFPDMNGLNSIPAPSDLAPNTKQEPQPKRYKKQRKGKDEKGRKIYSL